MTKRKPPAPPIIEQALEQHDDDMPFGPFEDEEEPKQNGRGPPLPAAIASEFLAHCQAAPEPCKNKVLSYVKFLADAGWIDGCIMHLPADDVAVKLIGWMREHPDKDWIDSLDTALTALDLCGK
jgi:hypothetical protein